MQYWSSPFPLPAEVQAALTQLGLSHAPSAEQLEDESFTRLWLYDRPDRILSTVFAGSSAPSIRSSAADACHPDALCAGFRLLNELASTHLVLSAWRLLQAEGGILKQWLAGEQPLLLQATPPPVIAEAWAPTLALLECDSFVLESYLDLELRAELGGTAADSHYGRWLRQHGPNADALWLAMVQPMLRSDGLEQQQEELEEQRRQRQESQEEAELTLLQLHQVQEELEQIFLADREKQQQLEQLRGELDQQRQQSGEQERVASDRGAELERLQVQIQGVTTELEEQRRQRQESQEEAELTLLQLHQVQEELEHYFLLSRQQSGLLARHRQMHQRGVQLLRQKISPHPQPA
jgi:hypothetical protein